MNPKVTKEIQDDKLTVTAAHLGAQIATLKRLQMNQPEYPKELFPLLQSVDFDRSRLVMVDDDLDDYFCQICVEDREAPEGQVVSHVWIEIPSDWVADETERYMKDVRVWDEYNPEEEYLIADWLNCNLMKYDRDAIVNTVFNRVVEHMFENIIHLPV